METFRYDHFPLHLSAVHVALFTNVSNSSQLRSRIVHASLAAGVEGDREREAVNFAFIDARLICSVLHLQTAIAQAILAQVQGSLRTKTVHSEILWALSPNNNITDAIKRFGVSDSTTSICVVRISSPELDNVQERMKAVVSGDLASIGDLERTTDWSMVKKSYKLHNDAALKTPGMNAAQEQAAMNEIVISSVAMKSVLA